MSDIQVTGFQSSALLAEMAKVFAAYSEKDKKAQMDKTKASFELQVSNDAKETATWTIDLKKTGSVYKGPAKPKADVTIILSDETLQDLAAGKTNGQKAFLTGKLKTKGNMMLAMKLEGVLKTTQGKIKAKL
ncbi:sterol-binding-like protein [Fistulina hepatica ATCC 64428]|nr:sterol-binding-like protein [Fistulina hepatica ATCC 64428]